MKTFEVKTIIEICSLWSNWYTIIASDNGSAPNKRQAIVWSKDDRVHRRINALTWVKHGALFRKIQNEIAAEVAQQDIYSLSPSKHRNLVEQFP